MKLLRLPAVLERTGVSRSLLYLLEARGEFPRRLKLTARCVGWRSDDIEDWITRRPRVPHKEAP